MLPDVLNILLMMELLRIPAADCCKMLVLKKKESFQESMNILIQARCKAGHPFCSIESRNFRLFGVQILEIICCHGRKKKVIIMFHRRLTKFEFFESKLQLIRDCFKNIDYAEVDINSEEDVGPLNSPLK